MIEICFFKFFRGFATFGCENNTLRFATETGKLTPSNEQLKYLLRLYPRLFYPTSTPAHSYIRFTLSIYPYHCPLPMMTRHTFVH